MVDPKVGFAIICKCRERQQGLDVLSVRRGPSSPAPGKWSFPGGKLELGEDNEEQRVLTLVEAQCGGGKPSGLPPMIHIIRLYNETAKVKQQTIYHVFVLDADSCKDTTNDWLEWCPGVSNGSDIDTLDADVNIGENVDAVCSHGFFWMDLDTLIEMCTNGHFNPSGIAIDSRGGTLHPGLVKWIQNHGRSVMKMLITRSPKQARARSSSSASERSSPQVAQPLKTFELSNSRPLPPAQPPTMYGPVYSSPPLLAHPTPFAPYYSTVPLVSLAMPPSSMHSVPMLYTRSPPPPVKMDKGVVQNSLPPPSVVNMTASVMRPTMISPYNTKQVPHKSHIICQYFIKGSCKFGQSCRYLHPDFSSSKPPSSSASFTPPQAKMSHVPLLSTVANLPEPSVPLQATPQISFTAGTSAAVTMYEHTAVPRVTHTSSNIPFQLIGQVGTDHLKDSGQLETDSLLACKGQSIFFASPRCVWHYKLVLASNPALLVYPEQAVSCEGVYSISPHNQATIVSLCSTSSLGTACLGTSDGSMLLHDFTTKGNNIILNGQNGPAITSLLHYLSSDFCQVVVGGNAKGMLFWHKAKAHQKSFSSLLTEQKHSTKITGLELVGNQMVSTSEDGKVYFWSVGGQLPVGMGSYSVCEAGVDELSSFLVTDRSYHFMTLTRQTESGANTGSDSHLSPCIWKYGNPPTQMYRMSDLSGNVSCAAVVEYAPFQSLVVLGLSSGIVNVYASPLFTLSAQLLFEDMNESVCVKMAATLESSSQGSPEHNSPYSSLQDVLIVSLWSCGVIKICKVGH